MATGRLIVLITLGFLYFVGIFLCPANAHASDTYIRAAHYFGDASPLNFWSSVKLRTVDRDFKRIKKDGFNTIVLVVPWGEFQPGLDPIRYNYQSFDLLKKLINKAASHNLQVILRLSYHWDCASDEELPRSERFAALCTSPSVYDAWLHYLQELYRYVGNSRNLLFGFISWEDLWWFVGETSDRFSARRDLARTTGFQAYIRNKYDLSELSKLYAVSFSSYEEVPLPDSKTPAFRIALEYFDHLLLDKFFKPAKRAFPKLSMEVRVDEDPVRLADGKISWYSHASTYSLPSSEFTTIYFSVAMNAQNRGDEISAGEALGNMKNVLEKIRARTAANRIFIDQFIYFDNTPAFALNSRVKRAELDKFLAGAAPILRAYSDGYALWSYKDYAANVIHNPSFDLGLKGWQHSGEISIVRGFGGEAAAVMGTGSTLSQNIDMMTTRSASMQDYRKASFCYEAKAEGREGAEIEFDLGAGPIRVIKTLNNVQRSSCFTVPMQETYMVTLHAREGRPAITNISLYAHVQEGKVYGLGYRPGPLLKAIRKLNDALRGRESAPKSYDRESVKRLDGVYADSWVGEKVRGRLYIPKHASSFRVNTYLPPGWPHRPIAKITVGKVCVELPVSEGLMTQDLPIEKFLVEQDKVNDFTIETSPMTVPYRYGLSADKRALGFQLLAFGVFKP
ncbi:MAG: hypothetical protein ABSB94_09375 [Syntrophorhabdales bacterium]